MTFQPAGKLVFSPSMIPGAFPARGNLALAPRCTRRKVKLPADAEIRSLWRAGDKKALRRVALITGGAGSAVLIVVDDPSEQASRPNSSSVDIGSPKLVAQNYEERLKRKLRKEPAEKTKKKLEEIGEAVETVEELTPAGQLRMLIQGTLAISGEEVGPEERYGVLVPIAGVLGKGVLKKVFGEGGKFLRKILKRGSARGVLPRSGPIARSLGAASRAEMIAKRVGLNIESPIARQVLNNLDMMVTDFIGKFRRGAISRKFTSEFLDRTVEEALLEGGSSVRKLLTDTRF